MSTYGGELANIIKDKEADTVARALHRIFVEEGGFSYLDVRQIQEFRSLEKTVSTYGFIFGGKAIDDPRTHRMTSMKWHMRMFHKTIESIHYESTSWCPAWKGP